MLSSNIALLYLWMTISGFVGMLDWETSEHKEQPEKIPTYILINVLTWYVTLCILIMRVTRYVNRNRRKTK